MAQRNVRRARTSGGSDGGDGGGRAGSTGAAVHGPGRIELPQYETMR